MEEIYVFTLTEKKSFRRRKYNL